MPWPLYWTCLLQVIITLLVLAVPVSFFLYMVRTSNSKQATPMRSVRFTDSSRK